MYSVTPPSSPRNSLLLHEFFNSIKLKQDHHTNLGKYGMQRQQSSTPIVCVCIFLLSTVFFFSTSAATDILVNYIKNTIKQDDENKTSPSAARISNETPFTKTGITVFVTRLVLSTASLGIALLVMSTFLKTSTTLVLPNEHVVYLYSIVLVVWACSLVPVATATRPQQYPKRLRPRSSPIVNISATNMTPTPGESFDQEIEQLHNQYAINTETIDQSSSEQSDYSNTSQHNTTPYTFINHSDN